MAVCQVLTQKFGKSDTKVIGLSSMSLSAINQSTGEYVSCRGIINPAKYFADVLNDLRHPITGCRVTGVTEHFRQGIYVCGHFRSIDRSAWPENVIPDNEYLRQSKDREYINESPEHRSGKLFVAENAQNISEDFSPDLVRFEYRVMMPSREKYRIIDVAFVNPSGQISAHEVQLAFITPEELTERTLDYWEAGINVIWWLGKEAKTTRNIETYKEVIGSGPCILDFEYTSNNRSTSQDLET
ncbi:MAG: competence protein CoiA family protein [Cyanobacteria bacterium P01_A01_bin.137]